MPALLTAIVSAPSCASVSATARRQILGRGDAAGQRDGLAAQRDDPRRGLLESALGGMPEAGDVGARLGQPDGDGLADAAPRAGHQRDLAGKVEQAAPGGRSTHAGSPALRMSAANGSISSGRTRSMRTKPSMVQPGARASRRSAAARAASIRSILA